MLCFRKLLVAKKFMDNREEKCHDFPSNVFCLTVPEKFVGDPFVLCFRKVPVAKTFMDKKGGGEASRFSVEFFCVKVPKNFVGEPSIVSLFSVIEKSYAL